MVCVQKNDLVSVIIVASDNASAAQMYSMVLEQTYESKEIIIINKNDNSVTKDMVSWGGKDNRISALLNTAINKAAGKYVTWLEEGEKILPGKIAEQVEMAKKYRVPIVCSGESVNQVIATSPDLRCELALCAVDKIGLGAFLVERAVLDINDGFDLDFYYYQDYKMWENLLDKNNSYFSNDKLYCKKDRNLTKISDAIKEGDEISSRLLFTVPDGEIELYDRTQLLEEVYAHYIMKGYKQTAAILLYKILQSRQKQADIFGYKMLIQQEILGAMNCKSASCMLKRMQQFTEHKKTRKTIVFYSRGWMTGGVERVLSNIMPGLETYYNVALISDTSGIGDSFPVPEEILHIQISHTLKTEQKYRLLILALFLKADVFIGTYNQESDFIEVYTFMEKFGIKTIASNHIYYFLPCRSREMYPLIQRRSVVFKEASAVTWLTQFNTFLGTMISDNSVLMPNPNTFEPREIQKQNSEKIILCVGRFFDPIKRVDRMLKIFRKVIDQEPEAKLWLVGRYAMDVSVPRGACSVQELIKELDFPNETAITWWGEQGDVEYYYEKASLLMLTSDNEGFGMVLNEAGIRGCPGIVMEVPGLDDIILNGENGYIFAQDDIDAMADKIIDLLKIPEQLENAQHKAIEYAKRFDKKIIVERWKNLIETICYIENKEKRNVCLQRDFGYEKEREQCFIDKAIKLYEHEIRNAIESNGEIYKVWQSDMNVNEIHMDKFEGLSRCWKEKKRGLDVLKEYEYYLSQTICVDDQNIIAFVLKQLPLGEKKTIGIYGTGVHTERMLNAYEQLIGKINANIIFIDSKKRSLTEQYRNCDIYNVHDISKISLDGIIISSILYENEMFHTLIDLYGEKYKIYRFYDKYHGRLF